MPRDQPRSSSPVSRLLEQPPSGSDHAERGEYSDVDGEQTSDVADFANRGASVLRRSDPGGWLATLCRGRGRRGGSVGAVGR